jgi:hypothetical protein
MGNFSQAILWLLNHGFRLFHPAHQDLKVLVESKLAISLDWVVDF